MHSENRTVVGIFPEITDARRAADELHSKGISTARLIENDQVVTFTGTAEREGASSGDHVAGEHHKSRGIKGFFARLFGFEDDRHDWKLSSDSESFFQDAYNKKHHLVIIEDCINVSQCRDIISQMGGVAEEQGSHYYHSERRSQRDQSMAAGASAMSGSSRPLDLDESLDSGRRSSSDQAADSGLGVDVDRMPFAHHVSQNDLSMSDRISQSGLSGTADHIPFSEQRFDPTAPAAGQSADVSRGQTPPLDASFGTGVSVPSEYMSFGGQASGDSLMANADQMGSDDREASNTKRSSHAGVVSDSNSMPFAGQSLDTGARAERAQGDRALNGISGDADRTPLAGVGASGARALGASIIGDDRVHDRGVSNADVARISSDRIMELDDEDQHLADEDTDIEAGRRRAGAPDPSLDNGHILPDRSFPPARPQDTVQPGP